MKTVISTIRAVILAAPAVSSLMIVGCGSGTSSAPQPALEATQDLVLAAKASPSSPPQVGTARGGNMLEQAILDAFPNTSPKSKAARKAASNAADFVGYTINRAGYLCSKPIEMKQAASEQYGIGCIKHEGEGERANYLIDVRSGSVNEI